MPKATCAAQTNSDKLTRVIFGRWPYREEDKLKYEKGSKNY
jgi:hypothetical protein